MNKKIVLYLFIGLSIFAMACGDDNVGTTTTIEDFESGSLALYKCPLGENNFALKTTAAHDGANGLIGSGGAASGDPLGSKWIYRDDAAVLTNQGDRLSVWIKRSNTDAGATPATAGASCMGFGASAAGCYAVDMQCQQSLLRISKVVDYRNVTNAAGVIGTITLATVPQTYIANRWYKIIVEWNVGGLIVAYLYDSDGSTLLNTVSATDNTWTSGGIGFRGFTGDYYFDTYERYVKP